MKPRSLPASFPLLAVLRHPEAFLRLEVATQDLVLRQARRAGILGRLAWMFQELNLMASMSPRVVAHLESARRLAEEDRRLLTWEVNRIERALWGSGLEWILLKGAAYASLNLPMAQGRYVADCDILVREGDLLQVETRMTHHGWRQAKMNPYDQHYYREWMHELPPMHHGERMTELDIHHTIVPRTSRLHPEAGLLFEDAQNLPGKTMIKILSPVDMVLHGAVHLFHDNDFDKGLRGILDLDGLLRHFGREEAFWDHLLPRASRLGLMNPLCHALHHCFRELETPIPKEVFSQARHDPEAPGWMAIRSMDLLIPRAIHPGDPDRLNVFSWLSWSLLYLRSHWLRMPPGLLFQHLLQKGLRRWRFDVRNRRIV